MSIFQNVIFFLLLYIIYIEKSLSIKQNQTSCQNDQKFSSLLMDCIEKDSLIPDLSCDGNTEPREDGLRCIEKGVNNENRQKNYFGYFFPYLRESTGKDILKNPYNDTIIEEAINKKCENEYSLVCQNVLNLYTVKLWNKNINNDLYKFINNTYLYRAIFLDNSLLENTNILSDITFSLVKDNNQNIFIYYLNFWVAKYYYNGTLLMFDRLENNFLQCSNSRGENLDSKTFGNNMEIKCFIDITKYLDYKNDFFYEIYLEDNLLMQPKKLVEIPIKIINEGENKNENPLTVKRMFLHFSDEADYYYAKKVKLCVKTVKVTKEEKIYLPFFEVTYAKKENSHPYIEYTFITEYKSDISSFLNAMKIIFIILTIIVGLLVIYRTFVWTKMNPSELIDSNYFFLLLFEIFYKACKYLGKFYFWFTFGISAYWYFFYKLQFRVYYFMPPLDDQCYVTFTIIFCIGFCCYILYMLIRIYKQVSFDIFFIDWETEKNMAMYDVKSSLDKKAKYRKYRSAWRMIHVVNQFNELQKKRIFHLYFAFSWIVLLYNRCFWDRKEYQVPRDEMVQNAPINFVLRNFIASIIVLASASVELVLVRLLQIWLPLKKQEFMDLCSVSNISVFILDGLLHGYYIHGLSPIGKADVNYDELFTFLNVEGAGTMRNRGLENDNDEDHNKNQSYEMFISHAMRTIYDGLYIIQTESMLAKGVNAKKVLSKTKIGLKLFRNFLNYEKDQTLLDNYMNNQLKSKIDIVSSNTLQYIKDKTLLQRIMGYTIDNTEFLRINAPDIIFYRDYRQNFDDVLFSGMEWEWFIMDLFFFQAIMVGGYDEYIAMLITFIIDYILYYIRSYFGNRNVSKKAVIDDRFLN